MLRDGFDPSKRNISQDTNLSSERKNEIISNYAIAKQAIESFAEITIVNSGTKAAENIVVDLPGSGLGDLKWSGGLQHFTNFNSSVWVGTLRPLATCKIRAWFHEPFTALDQTHFRITYADGVLPVDFPIIAEGLPRFIQSHKGWFYIPAFILGLAVFESLSGHLLRRISNWWRRKQGVKRNPERSSAD